MRIPGSKRVLAFFLIVLLALFIARPRVGLLHNRVAASLGAQLGRRVEVSSVQIRFLPRPGLELENLAIYENGSGAEPLLRSPEVIAWLRVSSLLRHRIEISQLSLSDASLNLGRNSDGKWNIEDLLLRTSRSTTAPTGSNRKEPRREFPYIEADHARVNFKNGIEKTHFALTNAEFALWQDSDNQWSMRMRASPIRTDANLTDTGIISVSGSWLRSVVLANTPIRFSLQWKQAQIGQLSKLLSGAEEPWRGNVLAGGTLTGTIGSPKIAADLAVDGFRRQEVLATGDLNLRAHCAAEYNWLAKALTNLDCKAPVGGGSLEMSGDAAQIPSSYDFKLLARGIPAQSLLEFARHVGYAAPPELRASGDMKLDLSLIRPYASAAPELKGEGEITGTRLASANTGTELQLGTIPLKVAPIHVSSASKAGSSLLGRGSELQIGPVSVALGSPAPVEAQLFASGNGYKVSLRGEAGLKRLLSAARMLRVPAPQVNAEGSATLNLSLSHEWGSTSTITGTAQLQSVHAQVIGLNAPLQIRRADLAIAPEAVHVTNLEASASDTTWRGSLLIPRPCVWPDACAFQFRLRSARVSAAVLNELLNPAAAKRPWYRLLTMSSSSNSFLAKANAGGSIAIDKVILGSTTCNRFSGDLALRNAKISLSNIHANVMSGRASGALKADFSARPPSYSGTGTFDGVSLSDVALVTGGEWADGFGSANYKFRTEGWTLHELLSATELSASFTIEDGTFPHVVLTQESGALRAKLFSGEIALHDGQFSFNNTKLQSDGGIFTIGGTASLTGNLNLTMSSENSSSYSLSGTLAETRVSPLTNPSTQAALKP